MEYQTWKHDKNMLNKLIRELGNLNNERRIARRRKFRQNYWRIRYTKRTAKQPFNTSLTKTRLTEFKEYWEFVRDVYELDPMYCQFYTNATGVFDPRYMSDDFYYTVIDTYYNDWTRAKYFDNKTLYPAIFKDIPQPEIIALRKNGFWSLNCNEIISEAELIRNCILCKCFHKQRLLKDSLYASVYNQSFSLYKISITK